MGVNVVWKLPLTLGLSDVLASKCKKDFHPLDIS